MRIIERNYSLGLNVNQILDLPKLWGDGTSAAADGTKMSTFSILVDGIVGSFLLLASGLG